MEDNTYKKNNQPLQTRTLETSESSLFVFDSLVTREYLHSLSNCEVIPLDAQSKHSPVRWYKIEKIVIEKDAFFTDKLSMLYMSLHQSARNVVLVLNKENNGDIELYIGARDFKGNNRVSGEILEAGMQGYFPGIGFSMINGTSLSKPKFTTPSVASVSAVASLRDDKKEEFVQGLERLINATQTINQFRTYFIADSINATETKSMINAFNNLYTSLSPAETLQMTYSESKSHSVSESITENISKTIGESISSTVTHTGGYSKTYTDNTSEGKNIQYNPNILQAIKQAFSGGQTESSSSNSSKSIARGENSSESEADQKGSNSNETKGTSNQNGTSDSTTLGTSQQVTYSDRTVKYYLEILDKHINRLQTGAPFGLWSVATYFVANDTTTAQQLANIYRGSIVGEESALETCAINVWKDSSTSHIICDNLQNSVHPRFDFNSINVSAGSTVTSKELAINMSFPQTSVPGVIVEEQASFARNIMMKYDVKKDVDSTITVGNILHLGQQSSTEVALNIDELSKHTFVTGSTGSGKSNTMYNTLSQLKDRGIAFLVIEPAKGEYKHVFGHDDDVTVYSSTPKFGKLLQINPFAFPWESVDVLEHVDRLVEIFNASWPMYAAMPSVLKKSIIAAYEKCGWNLLTTENEYTYENGKPIFPTIEDVLVCLKEYINHSEYSSEAKGNYKGALETRLTDINSGLLGLIFSGEPVPDDDLFNKNAIIDLSRIGSTETKSLIMGFLVMKLNEFRMAEGGMNLDLRHITVLEEAHNLLKKTSSDQSQETANLTGKSVEMISNSIAEMRTYGEGFIIVDQSPSLLDTAAIRNTNTKIVMALPEIADREIVGKSIALSDEQIEQIACQSVGEAIVYQNSWEKAVQCKINKSEKNDSIVYSRKYTIPHITKRVVRASVLNFLLHPYTQKDLDIDTITQYVKGDVMPSSIRVELLDLLGEYKKSNTISIWNQRKFVHLSQVVANYLNIDKDVTQLKARINSINGVSKFNLSFNDLLKERIEGIVDQHLAFYIQQGYVQKFSPEHYKNWLTLSKQKSL